MEELVCIASQPLDDGSVPIDIKTFYFKAVGGEKRRRVYSFGSPAASVYPAFCQNSGTSYTSQATASAACVREIVQQEFADKKAQMDREIAE